jgi:vancomycin resistance protein VanJ
MQESIAPPSRAAAKIILIVCLAYLLALTAVTVLLWTLADQWWPATVLAFAPRWLLATPLLVLFPLALRLHRPSLITLTAASALIAWPIMGLHIPWNTAKSDGQTPSLRIVTLNIHRSHLDAAEFKVVLDQLHPDVVALQDWSSEGHADIFPPDTWNTRRDGELLLASRYPIDKAEPIPLDDPPPATFHVRLGAAAYYRLLTPLGSVNLINLHLSSAHEALQALRDLDSTGPTQLEYNTRCRDMESSTVEKFATEIGNPVLILGDFNTPMESVVFRQHWDRFSSAFSEAGVGFGTTHMSAESSVRIDHILLGAGWRARSCWIGPAAGSPHRPLVADLDLGDGSTLLDADIGR